MRWFLRVVAIYCLIFGLLYWVRLIGYYDGDLWRFDLMPSHWKAGAASLAVLFPIAAIGLWSQTSWGPVMWFICVAIEAVMYAGFPELFGNRLPLIVSHLLIALLYVALRVLMHLERRRDPRRI